MKAKKITCIMLLTLFFLNGIAAQEKSIKVFNKLNEKQIIIKENKRVKIRTFNGLKVSGRFKIIDHQTIIIGDKEIKLSQIKKMKRNPLLLAIGTRVFLFYTSAVLSVTGIVYAFTGCTAAFLLIIPSTACTYGVIKPPNLLREYKTTSNWKYQIIESK